MNIKKQFYRFKEEISKRFRNLDTNEKIKQIPNSWRDIDYNKLNQVDRIEIGILTALFLESFVKKQGKVNNLTELLFDSGVNPYWEFILTTAKNIQIDRIDYTGNFLGAMSRGIKVNHIENAGKYVFFGSKDCFVNYTNYAFKDFAEFSENFKFNTINQAGEYSFSFSKNAYGKDLEYGKEQFGAGSLGLNIKHIHRLEKLGMYNSVNGKIGRLDKADHDFGVFSKNLTVKDVGVLDDCAFTKSINGKIGRLSYSDSGLGYLSKNLEIGEWHRGAYLELSFCENATVKRLLFKKRPEWKLETKGLNIGGKK